MSMSPDGSSFLQQSINGKHRKQQLHSKRVSPLETAPANALPAGPASRFAAAVPEPLGPAPAHGRMYSEGSVNGALCELLKRCFELS